MKQNLTTVYQPKVFITHGGKHVVSNVNEIIGACFMSMERPDHHTC